MSDTIKEELVDNQEVSQNNQKTINIKDLTESLKDAMSVIETQKKQIAGLDNKVTTLTQTVNSKSEEVETVKKEKLTDLEVLQLQMKELQETSLKSQMDAVKANNEKETLLKFDELKLPKTMLNNIDYSNTDTLQEQINMQLNIYNDMKQQIANDFAVSNGGQVPKAPSTATQKSWKEMTTEERTSLWVSNESLARQMMNSK